MKVTSHPQRRSARGVRLAVGIAVSAVVLAGCAAPSTPSSTPTALPDVTTLTNEELVAAAQAKALEIVGGEKTTGALTFISTTGGQEGERIKALIQPFVDGSGITVDYQSTPDVKAVVQTQVSGGNAPDVVIDSIGLMRQFVESGDVASLDTVLDRDAMIDQFGESVIDQYSVDGKLYGVPGATHNYQFWYNKKVYTGPTEPSTWDEILEWAEGEVKDGKPSPFCMTLNQGANTASTAGQFIDNLFLKEYGPEALANVADGKTKFSGKEMKATFEKFLTLFEDGLVYGGAPNALSQPTIQGAAGMFTDPQQCQIVYWGSFVPGVIASQNADLVAGEDFDYFTLASDNSDYDSALYTHGWTTFSFNDDPATQAFMQYYASVEFQSLAASTGGWVMGNRAVPTQTYPSETQQAIAQTLQEGQPVYGPFNILATAPRKAYLDAIVVLIQDPSQLKTQLQLIDDAIAASK